MNLPLGKVDPADFLREYWQKKPLLIRQAFPAFEPELDANDIAGLACDELAEARLISGSYPEHDWKLEYGPFDEATLRSLPDNCWTLLVQDVEKHYPPLRQLLDVFNFLPRWRIDDLMVSVAAPGGSVGPHTDQYDVFLLQAQGRRCWQIAEDLSSKLQTGTELNVLMSFEPEQEWTLEPGDMLYLPPGVAHHGVALDSCMTWSIGMRAPSSADLLQAFGEWLATRRDEGTRYADPDLDAVSSGAEIDDAAVRRFTGLATGAAGNGADFREFLGCFLSRYRLPHEPLGPEHPVTVDDLLDSLSCGGVLRHNPWTRLLWSADGEEAALFAAGSAFPCSKEFAEAVCDRATLERTGTGLASKDAKLLCELVNSGHIYLEAEQ
jgi:50S ribosomal protein L16 3-hydroxylase